MSDRYIIHIDMDAFFAQVEQRDNPQIRNKPVVIGADPKKGFGRGVVSTCSYEARKFGIHSAMPISTAYKKCPEAVFLRGSMKKYADVSKQMYDILYQFSPQIEPVGIDEAFLDITKSYHLFKTPINTAKLIKKEIKEKLNLSCSIGLAPTKMAAKIASDLEKPDGLVVVGEKDLKKFLKPLSIAKIWGVGKKTTEFLNQRSIFKIGDFSKLSEEQVVSLFGDEFLHLWFLSNGVDQSAVETTDEVKSISNEITFEHDTRDRQIINSTISKLCEKVSLRLRRANLKAKTITLKVRVEGFKTYTKAVTLTSSINFSDSLYKTSRKLFNNLKLGNKRVRLLGVKVSRFIESDVKETLFDFDIKKKKKTDLYKAVDKIKTKYGCDIISQATTY